MHSRPDTRARLADAAALLFAERGYSGASIAAIANELGLTKQALLHHFGSKEKLYDAVLEQLSARLMARLLASLDDDMPPEAQLEACFAALCDAALERPADLQLALRELFGNKPGGETAGVWYLGEFMQTLVALVQATRRWDGAGAPLALAVACQLLGAVSVFAVSGPALAGIFGGGVLGQAQAEFPATLRGLVRAAVT